MKAVGKGFAMATRETANMVFPRTQADLDARNRMLASIRTNQTGVAGHKDVDADAAHNALELPGYD